ncbi:MAG: EscU/YscU/HrcU family type III secretion system export apparatus switch protein [Spirochaetaceae bacterium]|jgi:flagellar biosynthesis protein|nr:EscU/YscU/HrcU family type III secretion system export apparatus switch protein [Spirochaetaceae bacterium]
MTPCVLLIRRCKIKEKVAAALSYTQEDPAPRVVASGRNGEALRILAIAREAGITVVEDSVLAVLLETGVNVGEYIPPWCWEATAKILAFVRAKEQ